MTAIRIRLLWHPQAQFAGYLVAEQRGFGQPGIALSCVPMTFDKGPIDALLDGDVTFAVASPAHMLESRAPDDLVLLLAIQQTSALVYPARRSAGIRGLADLAGRRVGVWPGREDLEFRWMLQRAGVDPAAVSFLPMNDTVAGLCDGVVECAQMTSYHEIHHLQDRAGPLDDFTLFSAADHGAALLKDGLIARRDWVARHVAETQAAIDAVLKGWTLAFTDASAAVEACLVARPDVSEAEHRRQLADIRALALTGATRSQGLGYPDPRQVARAAEALSAVHSDQDRPAPEGASDARFWAAAPEAYRSRAL